ncbi:MAG: glycosyltransferase N-terminal domain-containing protein, partial [Pseudomonadota bacterium]
PLDAGGPVHRFYDHWRPQAGIFVESELWPRLIVEGGKRGLYLAVLNARLSQKSVKTWCKFPATTHFILDQFDLFLTQNAQSADNLSAMGAEMDRVRSGSNLKAMSAPLPVDEQAVKQIGAQSADRPIWVASSTHPGEEQIVLAAHQSLLETHPDLLLLLVPRHPERGDEVARVITEMGLAAARRTVGEAIRPDIQVYLADTLGELGAWYSLCPLVFLGGSLKDIGGHNPFEPAQAGAAVITGPGYFNFAETYRAMLDAGAAVEVRTGTELAKAVDHWLTDAASLDRARSAARVFAQTEQSALDGIVDQLCLALKLD